MKHERDELGMNAKGHRFRPNAKRGTDERGLIVSAMPQDSVQQGRLGGSGAFETQISSQPNWAAAKFATTVAEHAVPHILCVDDEPDILEMAALSLEMVGNFEVTCVSNGSDALPLASELLPDLILLDVMMPVMAGPATLQALRSNVQTAEIPVVFMTARVRPEEVEEYVQLGASAVIHKPFDPMLLATQLGKIIDMTRDQ